MKKLLLILTVMFSASYAYAEFPPPFQRYNQPQVDWFEHFCMAAQEPQKECIAALYAIMNSGGDESTARVIELLEQIADNTAMEGLVQAEVLLNGNAEPIALVSQFGSISDIVDMPLMGGGRQKIVLSEFTGERENLILFAYTSNQCNDNEIVFTSGQQFDFRSFESNGIALLLPSESGSRQVQLAPNNFPAIRSTVSAQFARLTTTPSNWFFRNNRTGQCFASSSNTSFVTGQPVFLDLDKIGPAPYARATVTITTEKFIELMQ